MSEYMFGLGDGWMPKSAAKIAEKHGAVLVNYCDPGCKCGYGCSGDCPACKRHWFAGPFDGQLGSAVMAEIEKAGIKKAIRMKAQL